MTVAQLLLPALRQRCRRLRRVLDLPSVDLSADEIVQLIGRDERLVIGIVVCEELIRRAPERKTSTHAYPS